MFFLAIALVAVKLYSMYVAGPSPQLIKQTPITTEVAVHTVVPFAPKDINAPGPVRTSYMEGMQEVLDQSGTPGEMTVLGLKASLSTTDASLLQIFYDFEMSNSVVLEFEVGGASKEINAPADKLASAVQEAAKLQTGEDLPNIFKEVAEGTVSAAVKPTMQVSSSTSFRCKADHQLGTEIAAAGRVLIRQHLEEVAPELEKFAQQEIRRKYAVKLAGRCNSPSQAEAMKICIADESLWTDFVATHSGLTDNGDVCSAACTLAKALSAKTGEALKEVNKQLKMFEIDSSMVSKFSCVPALAGGKECGPCE